MANHSAAGRSTPKLVSVLREGYSFAAFRADLTAGMTVAIVALPLSMAIAIASGLPPERGLYTAIVGGFLVSALGGSRFQIGGPAGAFIVLVAATLHQHGLDGLILATLMSGLLLAASGVLGLGAFIKYIPYPVTVGFTSGIALIIFASQLRELLGLQLGEAEPGPLLPKLQALVGALPTVSVATALIAALSIASIVVVRRLRPHWPAFLIAAAACAALVATFDLPVATIASTFGGLPSQIPLPHLPAMSWSLAVEVLPAALAFTLLGAIESLLSAVVADTMSGRTHRSNVELVAQGVANVASAAFGGFCVTGTIARTATNVRAGAKSPIAGMLHSAFLMLFLMVAAPLAGPVPLAALAGILAVVAWNMAEKHEFATLLRASRGDAIVLLATFATVVLYGLGEGIVLGFVLGTLVFMHRMEKALAVDRAEARAGASAAQTDDRDDPRFAPSDDTVVLRISGAFFFAAATTVSATLDRLGETPKRYVLDFGSVFLIDSTAASAIAGFARKARKRGAEVFVCAAPPPVRRELITHGARTPLVQFVASIEQALEGETKP